MTGDVLEMDGKPRRPTPQASDFWFAQMDARLGKIEFVVGRLERQVWMIVCATFVLIAIECVAALSAGT